MNTIESTKQAIKKMEEIERRDQSLFRFGLSHLLYTGTRHFTDAFVAASMEAIDEEHREFEARAKAEEATGKIILEFMTPEYRKAIVTMAAELSQFSIEDILLYVKRNLDIYDPLQAADDKEEDDDWE